MAIASQQDIPNKPKANETWTFKRLFSFGAITTLAKVFVNPFDVLLGFIILVIGLVELLDRHVSWGFYTLAILILIASIFERHIGLLKNNSKTNGTSMQ